MDKYIRKQIRRAKTVKSPKILDELSRHENKNIRAAVALNPKWIKVQKSGLLDIAKFASKWLNVL